MKHKLSILLTLLCTTIGLPSLCMAQQGAPSHRTMLAFPGAEGYGRFTRGGRGGDVYHVTTLNDSGPGSIREGIESAQGPRTIVFDLSGTIALKSKLVINKSGITIAGQTAPGDGITLRDQCLNLNNASDIIIRYIRVRLGDKNKPAGDSPDCITMDDCNHVILDHVSSSWGIDGNQDTRRCANYTLQWSVMSEALNDSVHSKGTHAMCGSFRAPQSSISIHHNIFATSRDRHPTLGSGGKTDDSLGHIVDFRNNVIYNWTKGGTTNFCDNTVVAVNNVWRPGPESDPTVQPISIKGDYPAAANGIMRGNVFEGNAEWTRDNYAALNFERWRKSYAYRGTLADWKRPMPDQGENTPLTQPAMEALTLVLKQAGASLSRDAVDKRLVKNVRQQTGKLIDSQDEVGGWPELKSKPAPQDTDRDGMPDAWEQAMRLDPKDPADRNGDADNDGYTNLEEYLNSLCPQKDALTDNLALLNQWGEQPADIQRLYAAAFKVLSARPDATFSHVAADSDVQRLCADQGIVHLGGPMLGCVSSHGASVWIRTLQPARVEVQVTVDGTVRSFGPVHSTPNTDLCAVVPVTGLAPSTRYPYRVLVDGKAIHIPDHAAITTAPSEAIPGKVRIAFGTCTHRWGLGNQKQWTLIRERKPTAMLLGGDIAVQDRMSHCGLHRADYLVRDFFPAWKEFSASIPVCVTWDDHDYFNNDLWGIPKGHTQKDKENVCDVFCQAWNNPSNGFGDTRRGVFLRTRIGPCDAIMLDERYFRTGVKGSFLGDEQMAWLETQLLDCQGPFIILSCGTMWSDYVSNGKDSWGVWDPQGRERIFAFIETHRIPGVLLISGDRHGARGFRIPRPGGFQFYEFEAGSLGGRKGPAVTRPQWDTQFYGIADKYAFGEFTVDATLSDPEVTFRLIQDNGTVIHTLTLRRSQLTPPLR
ncbi:MAG: alkaline phosphatase D family protein [Phycisphaerae bacterium]|nr:alkaline phosphatase D family protein [Phycisphaerae bacterium]